MGKSKSSSIRFQYGDNQYQKTNARGNAFKKRTLPQALPSQETDQQKTLRIREGMYEYLFNNEKESYLARTVPLSVPSSLTLQQKDIHYVDQQDLEGNPREQAFTLNQFIQQIKQQLYKNPITLFKIAEQIQFHADQEAYEIKKFQAFENIQTWEEFITLLEGITDSTTEGKFELLSAAIIQYTKRCKRE